MAAETKGRPVLRPSGNVASIDTRGMQARKSTKKPPTSPPLKPSAPLFARVSPPNSQPTTPKTSLPKSPVLPKHSKPNYGKPSVPSTNGKPNTAIHSLHVGHYPGSVHSSPSQKPTTSTQLRSLNLADGDGSAVNLSPPSSNSSVTDPALPHSHVADNECMYIAPVDASSAHISLSNAHESAVRTKRFSHRRSTSDSPIAALNLTSNVRCSDTCDVVHADGARAGVADAKKSASNTKLPSQETINRRSILSRSSSDNFRRGSTAGPSKGNASKARSSSIRIASHSLDDASLAQLVAAKKAAASELTAQRKLKVSEYGRKLGKLCKIAPDIPSCASIEAEPQRCKFITPQSDPLYVTYHDEEWGVPVHDDRSLFELLTLAGAQVDLTWTTILHKREAYRNVFCGYDPAAVASFNEKHIQSLEADKSLLLQSGKVRGVVENAQRVLEVVKEFGSFDTYIWSFLNYKPMLNHYRYPKQLPAKTSKAEFISKDLVRRGFRFVGPTIIYSFMQAAGMTNDHLVQCFRHKACASLIASPKDDAEGKKSTDMTGSEHEVENDSLTLDFDPAYAASEPYVDSEPLSHEFELRTAHDSEKLLHELELKSYNLGQHFAHSDFVHVEAY